MLDPRLYRAVLVPALLAFFVLAFSLEDQPAPVRTTLPPEAFDAQRAYAELGELARAYPERRPGGTGDRRLAARVARELREAGFAVRTADREATTVDGERTLRTVVAERTGTTDERVVVLAHRDAARPGDAARLSATEGLLELARVFGAPRRSQRTLTLVSVSGADGAAGVTGLPELVPGPVEGALVLGDLASVEVRRPFVVGWSNALGIAPLRLRRTVEEAVRAEAGADPGAPRALEQVARFAAPATLGPQGPLLAEGWPAVLLSATGERGPAPGAAVSQERLEAFGRTALRAVTALDTGPATGGVGAAEVVAQRKVLPLWAVRLTTGMLLLPVLLAVVDGVARLRRRREPVGRWVRWVLAAALPPLLAALFARLLGALGLLTAPPAPVDPAVLPVQPEGLVAVGLALVLCALVLRPVVLRALGVRPADPAAPGAAAAVLVVLCVACAAVWARNPYAALLLLPVLHVWLFALVPELRPPRVPGLLLALLALAPLGLLAAAHLIAGQLTPLEGAWAALLLVAGGHASPLAWLAWSAVAGALASGLAVVWRGRARAGDADLEIRSRGPITYAGPGSLGAVESALRR
jgi:hypothetical protein